MGAGPIRVALAGIGNCAAALVQGLRLYADAPDHEDVPGLMHVRLGGYHIRDIVVVAAFDVVAGKVGRELVEAMHAAPNNARDMAEVEPTGVRVARGPTLDGLGPTLRQRVEEDPSPAVDVAGVLRASGAEVLVNLLPVGSDAASRAYAEAALSAGCAFVNGIPVFLATDRDWSTRFADSRLPLIGDDVKSQVGATIVHRTLAALFRSRGVRLDRTVQLNVGGNADFANMLDRDRLVSKRISKTGAVLRAAGPALWPEQTHIGPSDHVPWLGDRKWAFIRLEGTAFGGLPLSCELKLEVWDSPNSAGVLVDAIRCARLALDRGIGGALTAPCAAFMKSPPVELDEAEAARRLADFIQAP